MKKFVEKYIKLIASKPERVAVKETKIEDDIFLIDIYTDNDDMGRVIGKNGNMLKSINAVLSFSKAKGLPSYRIYAKNIDDLK